MVEPLRPRALVTGATRGIGRATALALAGAGFDVAIAGRTLVEGAGTIAPRVSEDEASDQTVLPVQGSLQATAAEVEALGARCLPVQMDLAQRTSVVEAVALVHAEWQALDLVVNNGFVHLPQQRFLDLTEDALVRTWQGNFYHQLLLTHEVLAPMLERGRGTIVNMASSSATNDPPAGPGDGGWGLAYAASKAAFGRIAGSINAEFGGQGVRAFNVDPGFVVTESAVARGGADAIASSGGYPSADPAASGQVIAWLATSPEAERFLGKTIWAPKLAADLASKADG
ncbi:SDR family oxidoreductase [Nocardioides marmorisolisilvae]|uniref:SDR family oxidoreductase n=1 Tax=Nocardioides marmorisolisilvae TaxID=1542737 RepID=A0A3N0DVI0_9ACTN|nr:SDR family oxidoreductase [Nocardioides marmorisolisilvae]RNL79624.1 SDR family oxidoreductase [Nocardioides marmorisolisilvae]